jgi:hypothetical protein
VKHLHIQTTDDGRLRISGIDPVLLDCLQNIRDITDQRDAPGIRARLFPNPTLDNTAANNDWQQLIAPELHHLFAVAADTLHRDLAQLTADPRHKNHFQITIPAAHLNAWLSAINQTRLILGELFHVTETDMTHADYDLDQPKHLALFRIHILGYLLQLLVEHDT